MSNRYTHYTHLVNVPGDVISRWQTDRIEPGQEYPYGRFDKAGDIKGDPDAPVWVEVEYATGSDYSGGTVNRANYEKIKEEFSDNPDIAFLYGGWGTFGVLVREEPTTDEVRDLIAGLENYPVVDEEALSEHENKLSEEAWDSWARSDFMSEIPKHLGGDLDPSSPEYEAIEQAVETLDDRDDSDGSRATHGLYELFRAAMEATNTYWEPDGTGMHVDVKRVTKGVTPELLASFVDETYTR